MTKQEESKWIMFEIRRSVIVDCLQREFVEIFYTLNDTDYCKEMKKLINISPNELKVVIITRTNINGEKVDG